MALALGIRVDGGGTSKCLGCRGKEKRGGESLVIERRGGRIGEIGPFNSARPPPH